MIKKQHNNFCSSLKYSILGVNNKTKIIMLHGKSTKIFSEINNYFTSQEKAILQISNLFAYLKLNKMKLNVTQPNQTQHDKRDLLYMLLLFPLFSINKVSGYYESALYKYLSAGKDTFYQFKNDSRVVWRNMLYWLNKKLLRKVEIHSQEFTTSPRCLCLDDTNLEKTGLQIEHIGKIWSHVQHKTVLGFKGLFLGYWDGKSFFGLDFSLHKEKGKNQKKPYGLKPGQLAKQYKKKRDFYSDGYSREQELKLNKIDNAILMIRRALDKKIKVDYVLMDSWFVCERILKFIKGLRQNIHLLGMAKVGTTKYNFEGKEISAKALARLLKNKKQVKRIKSIGMYCATTQAEYKGIPVKLFFCKTSKKGQWHLLLTTKLSLNVVEAYQIYSIRWSIEVFFKESKQHFQMGKSQSQDFDAQIADITISMMQYNIFSLAKRFEAYETLGQLFRESKADILELTIVQRIWGFILELIELIKDFFDIDSNELIVRIMKSDNKNNKIINLLQHQHLKAA